MSAIDSFVSSLLSSEQDDMKPKPKRRKQQFTIDPKKNYYPNVSKDSPFKKKLKGKEKNCGSAFYENRYKRAYK